MRIKYRILWIENETRWRETKEELIEGVLDDLGFEMEVTSRTSGDGFKDFIESGFGDFDLLLIDFDLGTGDHGDSLIQLLREHEIFTEVIFYSYNKPGIITKHKELGLEGVYLSDRDDEFEEKIRKIIDSSIKKVQGLSMMRGLVLAEVSDFDEVIDSILESFCNAHGDEKVIALGKYLMKKIKNSHKARTNKIEALSKKLGDKLPVGYSEFLDAKLIDSDKRSMALGELLSILGINDPVSKETFHYVYQSEVLSVRNKLAHAKESTVGSKAILITLDGEESYGAEEFQQIRQNLRKHKGQLDSIREQMGLGS